MAVRLTTPVTILTGFLGSGKTTMINRLLRDPDGLRIAVIENEFGEIGVDAEFLSQTGEETIIQLANGCLCCTVRGDLARALHDIARQASDLNAPFDRVLIETTGLADPGPVIQTFLAETAVQSLFHLDAVVAVVDALNAETERDRPEFQAQLGYADRIVVTKSDLTSDEKLDALEQLLGSLNPRAPIIKCDLREVSVQFLISHIFDAGGFAIDHVRLDEIRRAENSAALASERRLRVRPAALAAHSRGVRSCVFTSDSPLDLDRLNQALDVLVGEYGSRLWRCKGVVQSVDQRCRLIVQGVQGVIQINGGTIWRRYEPRRTVLIFIGDKIDPTFVDQTLQACVTDRSSPKAPDFEQGPGTAVGARSNAVRGTGG